MVELNQLEQLIAIEEYKTLSAAAEALNISQPALSRSIQRLEEDLEVTLFERQKNKITFNDDGIHALEYAHRIVDMSHEMKNVLLAEARSRRTISIGSCAPAPLWLLTPNVTELHPDMMITSELTDDASLDKGLLNNTYQMIITRDEACDPSIKCIPYCKEQLYISLPPAHPLATRDALSLSEINGLSILQYTKVGFWLDICKAKMPDSRFLMQDDMSTLNELRVSSALPAFSTNLTKTSAANEHRVLIPITDDEVNITFYLKYKKTNAKMFYNIKPLI